MSDIILRRYGDATIRQWPDGSMSATDMCKANGKEWYEYRRNKQTEEYLTELSARLGLPVEGKPGNPGLVQSYRGGKNAGTRVHKLIAVNLAQWCNARFAVQVSIWIDELLTTGKVDLRPEPAQSSGFDQLAAVILQLLQAQRQQGEMMTRLAESVAALAKPTMPAVSPQVQQVSPVTGVFALRERIRSMFPQADEYWRRRCVRAIERACRCQGVVPYPLYEGRGQANFLHQDMMPVVDQEITRVRGQWLTVNEAGARAERTLFDPQPQQAEGGGSS